MATSGLDSSPQVSSPPSSDQLMKPWLLSLLLILPATSLAADRVALVVGIGAYDHATHLPNAPVDGRSVAQVFGDIGFETTFVQDADLAALQKALFEFRQKAAKADIAVFYFAGHGMEFRYNNYLIPADAKLAEPYLVTKETVSLREVVQELDAAPAKLVILDCCRDNPFATTRAWARTRSSAAGLAAVDNLPRGTLVMFSAGPGQRALDGEEGANSPFTGALVDELPKAGVNALEAFFNVSDRVLASTEGFQEPWVKFDGSGRVFREMVFVAPLESKGTKTAAPTMPQVVIKKPQQIPEGKGPVHSQPELPQLPVRGYFTLGEVFEGGPYAEYTTFSRTAILKRVQEFLQGQEVYAKNVDGLMGSGTQQAILEWQLANQAVAVTGKLDLASLTAMDLLGLADEQPPVEEPMVAAAASTGAVPVRFAGPQNTYILPRFPLGKAGDRFLFDVHTPGTATYPHWIRFHTRDSKSDRPYTPFDVSVIRIEVLSSSGAVTHSRTIRPRGVRSIDGDEYEYAAWNRREAGLFRAERYQIRITIDKPSDREYDEAQLILAPVGG